MTPEELDQAAQLCKRLGPANCWTGCSGTLASLAWRMIGELREAATMAVQDTTETPADELLVEALATVRQRRATYGPPGEHFAKTVAAINAIFSHKLREPLTVADWAQIMILDKLARHQGAAKSHDTPVDLAGYAACLAEVERA